ncbi:uncharacterized protein LOC120733262 [Simochromis diagramma]|uniref:uncharacterized protein LOC120733262 n=1 Tax=Simochromis diagramma TaxID=43689 RepID=UPI001A7E7262|nr:uncharacterized protein LOC120733262 [Simochromis diagramma]
MEGGEETRVLQQAVGLLRNILSSPETVTTLSSSLDRDGTGSTAPSVTHSTVESEMRELFRPANTRVASTSQVATRSSTGVGQSLRYQTQKHFGNWNCRSRKRFQDGLRTLEVLDKIQAHPESFRTLLCWSPSVLTADLLDSLFTIRLSPAGSNKRHAEAVVISFWRDYLTDAEDQDGTQKLGTILAFATGANTVPPNWLLSTTVH